MSFFPHSLFFKILPQCNIPDGNQRDESGALVCSSYWSFLRGHDLGKIPSSSGWRNRRRKGLRSAS